MHIEAANVRPDFSGRDSITADQLRHVDAACVIFEALWLDDDGERCWAYTVGGVLDGKPLGGITGGVLVGGETIIVHADSREMADAIAADGLMTTMEALDDEERDYIEANAALARLSQVGPARRIELATADPANKSDEFVADTEAIRKLRGDDVMLTAGGVEN